MHGAAYRLHRPVQAVKLAEQPGSSLRTPTETLVAIPAGAVVAAEGAAGPSGLITVLWEGEAFSVFYEDLTDNARQASASGGA